MSRMPPATKRLLRDVHSKFTQSIMGLEGLATRLPSGERKALVDLIFDMDHQNKRFYSILDRAP